MNSLLLIMHVSPHLLVNKPNFGFEKNATNAAELLYLLVFNSQVISIIKWVVGLACRYDGML